VKLVVFSDLHLDSQFGWMGASDQAARWRRQALRETLGRIVQVAVDVQADALLCGGDLYENERFSPDTAQFLRKSFSDLHPLPIFLAPGHHDWLGPQSIYRQVEWSPNVHLFTEARFQSYALDEGLTLWGAAHRGPANTPNLLESFRVDRGGVHLALFHGSEQSGLAFQEEEKQPHAPFQAAQITAAGFHHTFLGHFHRARDADHHTYPGNRDPLSFGEDHGRGAVIVEDAGMRCTGPVSYPEAVGEAADKLICRNRISPVALDIEEQGHVENWQLVHMAGKAQLAAYENNQAVPGS
jgi:DNA repair protein SbcD/Mre11